MSIAIFFVLLLELIVVVYYDIKIRKIFNVWSIINVILFAPFFLQSWSYRSIIFPTGILLVGFLLYLTKVVGAGDVKFLASFFLLVPFKLHQLYFEILLVWVIIVASISISMTLIQNYLTLWNRVVLAGELGHIKIIFGKKIPFTPMILLAWIDLGIRTFVL